MSVVESSLGMGVVVMMLVEAREDLRGRGHAVRVGFVVGIAGVVSRVQQLVWIVAGGRPSVRSRWMHWCAPSQQAV